MEQRAFIFLISFVINNCCYNHIGGTSPTFVDFVPSSLNQPTPASLTYPWRPIYNSPIIQSMVWKFSRKLYEYSSYGSITLERIDIPVHTTFVNITFNTFSTSDSCSAKPVKVFAKQFGIPVVSRDNETFPDNSAIPREVHNITMMTNNQTKVWVLSNLAKGSLYIMAIFPETDTRIRQKGLSVECKYFITTQAKLHHFSKNNIDELPTGQSLILEGTSRIILSFRLPMDVLSYSLIFQDCKNPCTARAFVSENMNIRMFATNKTECIWKDKACVIERSPASVNTINYLVLSSTSQHPFSFEVKLELKICERLGINETASLSKSSKEDPQYRLIAELNRETPSDENQGSNFFDRFAIMDRKTSLPLKMISLSIPDIFIAVMRFKLRTTDTGSSLNIVVHRPIIQGKQDAQVTICVSPHQILNSSMCKENSLLTVDTRSDKEKTKLLFLYPESGLWYISLQSSCFNKSSNKTVACSHHPLVNMTVSMASCLEGKCGKYGSCKLYTGAEILYSACDCKGGWRGYGCNDGSKALSDFDERVAVYLLTLSNLGFIPGIIVALRRRLFIEALVYGFNMFFSTFYHACDTSYIYQLCIMRYNALSFADFFASLLSFAVTLLAMARIPQGLRSFLHMVMALFISVAEVYNRHGLVEQLLPIATGIAIVVLSWGFECYNRKAIFPSKRRYLKFILPGLSMASLGLILNLAVATEKNYKYIHSSWHILESLAIVFLLPPGLKKEGQDNTGLSIQSGDVAHPGEDINLVNDEGASFRSALDISSMNMNASSSSIRQSPTLRDRFRRIVGPRKTRQNFVL